MTDKAIQVENLSKRYRLGQTRTLLMRLAGMLHRAKRGGAGARHAHPGDCGARRDLGPAAHSGHGVGLRGGLGECRWAFTSRYENTLVVYASKAYLGRWIAALVAEEGLGIDVVSGGELAVVRSVNFPMQKVLFHGNNKSEQELREAVEGASGAS